MSSQNKFDRSFHLLTGNDPFPWQRALFEEFVAGRFPSCCSIPTGLGKTAVIPIWLIALLSQPDKVPRRLGYVVNRRTVVDQATVDAEKVRTNVANDRNLAARLLSFCADKSDAPLSISTLRGQFADNAEWRTDPARPAIIVGTPDMIGSRLLFSGYGCGYKSKPLHAGFLGQDVLLIHDEAHLEPAFQELLIAIRDEQMRCREFTKFFVMELSATSRSGGIPFGLTAAERNGEVPEVKKRLRAKKTIRLHACDERQLPERIAELALAHQESGQAILVFLRKVEDVEKVATKLPKGAVQQLTGTLRGIERDRLASHDAIFARFLPNTDASTKEGTVYLVCTSAGEVGVNISADHLVSDLTPFDSMAQRFGRVNRFGSGNATIDIVHSQEFDDKKDYELRRRRTLELLNRVDGNASPAALDKLPALERLAAFTPEPSIIRTSDLLFDAWSLTSIREPLPGRPPVTQYLHGVSEWEPPETHVVWREDVELLAGAGLSDDALGELLSDYPLKPHEVLRDRSDRVFKHLVELAKLHAERPAWLVDEDGELEAVTIGELSEDKERLSYRTVVLPPRVGGLSRGMLDGKQPWGQDTRYDVADDIENGKSRIRVTVAESESYRAPDDGMRRVAAIRLTPLRDAEEEQQAIDDQLVEPRVRLFFVRPRSADDDGSRTAREPIPLDRHLTDVERMAKRIAEALHLPHDVQRALIVAAKFHDLGKKRDLWQRSIGNPDLQQPLAKSGNWRSPGIKTDYRHEFGSLLDVVKESEFDNQSDDIKELALHLIATHHGRGRPHFPTDEVFDPKGSETDAVEIEREIPRRFARLQRKYGRWGLAYLESLLRAADIEASANPSGGER